MKVKKRAPTTLQRKGIKITGKWKPVSLDPNLYADGKMEEIICFEELTDYKLVKTSKELIQQGRKRKRGEEDSTGRKESKKRKKKLGAKKAKREDSEEEEENLSAPDEEEEEEDLRVPEEEDLSAPDEEEGVTNRKKKSKKWKKKMIKAKKMREDSEDEMEEMFTGGEEEEEEEEEVVEEKEENPQPAKKKKKTKVKGDKTQKAAKPAKKTKTWAAGVLAAGGSVDVAAWKDLCVPPPVLQALSDLGFSSPTPIQALALPSAIRDRQDILGAAETGSGKTLAFAIPMIHSILEWRKAQERGPSGEQEAAAEEAEDVEEDDEAEDVEEDEAEDGCEEEEEDSTVGCVKVVRDVDVNFNSSPPENAAAKRPLLGLVVTPTRELAVQVRHHIDAVARLTGIKSATVVGGMAPQKQERVLNRRPEIVIATPGRLWEMIRVKHPHLCNLRQLRCLVIDEADRMVEKGHYDELSRLLEMLSDSHYNPQRQTFVFSATLTLIHQAPGRLLQKKNFKVMGKEGKLENLMDKIGLKGKPKVIDLTRKQATVETLTETRIHCSADQKDYYLYYFLLQYPGRTMVFANSIDCIKRLTSLLTILECDPLPLHANMHQKQRLKNLERFAERQSCTLLTTDVAARGLDIPNIQHVLHYQVPRTSETYVHRSGRTARASSDGLTLLLIGPNDTFNFKKIFRTLEKDDELPVFPVEAKCMNGIEERVDLARQIEKVEYFNGKVKQQNSWIQQTAEAMEVELDDDDFIGGRQDDHRDQQKQKALKMMKKQLKRLLTQPIFRNVMRTKYPTQSGQLPIPHLPLSRSESALHTLSEVRPKKRWSKHKA